MSFICDTFTIAYANNAMISHALQNTAFTDFEDNLQDCCAQQVKADYIVTANIKDYAGHSVIPAITPSELLTLLKDYNSIPYYHTDDNQPCELRESHLEYEISPHISRSASYHKHFISTARHLTCTLVA